MTIRIVCIYCAIIIFWDWSIDWVTYIIEKSENNVIIIEYKENMKD